MTYMAKTTIRVDSTVRDRLRSLSPGRTTFNEILTQLMDQVDRKKFVAETRRRSKQALGPILHEAPDPILSVIGIARSRGRKPDTRRDRRRLYDNP